MDSSLRPLLAYAHEDDSFRTFATSLTASGNRQRAFVSAPMRSYLLSALVDAEYGFADRPAFIVASDDLDAREICQDLKTYLAPREVFYYPSRGVSYESHLTPPTHLTGLRIAALDAIAEQTVAGVPPVVVISAPALLERVPDPKLRPHGFTVAVDEEIDLDQTVAKLSQCGYERVDQVEDRGQFAVRGGILDLFPATEERAVRIELIGDQIERICWFSTFTQRSLEQVDLVDVAPAAELDLEYRELAELIAEEEDSPNLADLLPLAEFRDLFTVLPEDAVGIVTAEDQIDSSLRDHWQYVQSNLSDSDLEVLYLKPDQVTEQLESRSLLAISSLDQDQQHSFPAQWVEPVARSVREAQPEIEKLVRSKYRTAVIWSRRSELERAEINLAGLDPVRLSETILQRPAVIFGHGRLSDGFIAPSLKLAVIPEQRLLRRSKRPHETAKSSAWSSFKDLAVGVYVVHEDHGIARLAGFETKTVAEITRDYFYLQFKDGDTVFVPFDQMDKVSGYVGGGPEPTLSKLGGKGWQRLKARARKAAQEMAGELINLYAERQSRKGFSFGPDSRWQLDFESAFPYRETLDQASAIEDVKTDMEANLPMDRLVCGDVGYGKTEVALRAAFKSANESKQVMVLVPTTVLAQQHYGTFKERLFDYPFNLGLVSRFRKQAENKATLRQFSEGKIDILVGTHRLLSRDVAPKDLGLLVVDEEQRFGVKQKELLRQLKTKVDVLTLTATPIPRTLRMSLEGLRNISVIETPPQGRRPVKTYVGEYDQELIKSALEREKERGGQAFFLHNRVESIDLAAENLRALCPNLKFAVAHGQMEEGELEEVMLSFLRGESDCLVCTSIVESGLDIPQANTLIVDRADIFGLAQLYQIRGRVGRSRETSFAYLFYSSAAELSETAAARLATLSDYTELGSGFKIAMRDLEIRGAGNLLGDEQSGHVAAVGFELYCEMLEQAVAERSGRAEVDSEPVRLDLSVDAYVPAQYVPYEAAKIDLHRRVAAARDLAELKYLHDELVDRFGRPPQPVENLFYLQQARIKFGQLGVRTVTVRAERLTAVPLSLDSDQVRQIREEDASAIYRPTDRELAIAVPADKTELAKAVLEVAELVSSSREASLKVS